MKKIGIVTFWYSQDNYGQLLQCYALNKYLSTLGYDVRHIKVLPGVRKNFIKRLKSVARLILTPSRIKKYIEYKNMMKKNNCVNSLHSRNFNRFFDQYIPATQVFSETELFSNPPYFNVYVVGSDQVWSSLSPLFFLKFSPEGTKKIAYAASMGGFKPKGKQLETLRDFVADYDFVSLRETQALDFFNQNDVCEVESAPDPTLLLSMKDYKKISKSSKQQRPYILLYLLGNKLQFDISKIFEYAEKKDFDVVYVASQGRFDEYEKMYPSIEEWLGLIEGAELVVTNSFHGTVFSMIYQKKFVTLLLTGTFSKMNDRITDMLAKYGLENRIFCENWEEFAKEVNYSKFENVLAEEKLHIQEKMLNVIG